LSSTVEKKKSLLYLSFRGQLAVFFVELYMLFTSGGEFILLILFIGFMTPSSISFFSNVSVEIFDAFNQLFVSIL
jgi:hypothetical protein